MRLNEGVQDLIRRHGLEEDIEHIIIPLTDRNGNKSRCFLLKRPFIRIQHPAGNVMDYPIEEIIEAIIRYPEEGMTDAVRLLHEELDAQIAEIFQNEHKTGG